MAQAPTLYHFEIALEHTDRGISTALSVRTARHPSETLERVWLRVLAFAWHWHEWLAFGPGLSDPDAADLIANDLTGETILWARVGKADPVKMQKVVDQHPRSQVAVFFESPARMQAFIDAARGVDLRRLGAVALAAVDPALVEALSRDESRRSKVAITIAGDHFYIDRDGETLDGAVERGGLG